MKILVIIAAIFVPLSLYAFSQGQVQNAPYNQTLVNLIEKSTLDGEHVVRLSKQLWDTNVQGGTTTGTYNLPKLVLPANATIRHTYFYVKAHPLGSATTGTTWKVQCGSAVLFTAADISGKMAGTYFDGNQTGSAANMSDVGTSPCTAQVVQAVQGYNVSGQVDVYVEFETHD